MVPLKEWHKKINGNCNLERAVQFWSATLVSEQYVVLTGSKWWGLIEAMGSGRVLVLVGNLKHPCGHWVTLGNAG